MSSHLYSKLRARKRAASLSVVSDCVITLVAFTPLWNIYGNYGSQTSHAAASPRGKKVESAFGTQFHREELRLPRR